MKKKKSISKNAGEKLWVLKNRKYWRCFLDVSKKNIEMHVTEVKYRDGSEMT